jgi:hypothetical protein
MGVLDPTGMLTPDGRLRLQVGQHDNLLCAGAPIAVFLGSFDVLWDSTQVGFQCLMRPGRSTLGLFSFYSAWSLCCCFVVCCVSGTGRLKWGQTCMWAPNTCFWSTPRPCGWFRVALSLTLGSRCGFGPVDLGASPHQCCAFRGTRQHWQLSLAPCSRSGSCSVQPRLPLPQPLVLQVCRPQHPLVPP